MYADVDDVLAKIDAIPLGDTQWSSFSIKFSDALGDNAPSWKKQAYTIHMRDALEVQEHFLANRDFTQAFDYKPYKAYSEGGHREYSNLFSAAWAWKQAVTLFSYLDT